MIGYIYLRIAVICAVGCAYHTIVCGGAVVADVFKNAKPLGNFAAILFTYIASSILHVSAIQLLAVL